MRATASALLFGRIQPCLTRPFSSRTFTMPILPRALGSGMVKYSPLNHLPGFRLDADRKRASHFDRIGRRHLHCPIDCSNPLASKSKEEEEEEEERRV